ncbi:hypothetical protein Tco_0297726, partial [Tanacetum coccineum]
FDEKSVAERLRGKKLLFVGLNVCDAKVCLTNGMQNVSLCSTFSWAAVADVTGNSENVAVLQSTSDGYSHSVSRGINQKPDRNNTASRADNSRKHQDIQSE